MVSNLLRSNTDTIIRLVRPSALTPDHIAAWNAFLPDTAPLNSPFLHPQFSLTLGDVREDVEVAIIEHAGEVVGFFPFQREGRIGRPVGHPLADFHNVVLRRDAAFDAKVLIRECGLKSWSFDHLPTAQQHLGPFQLAEAESPYMDLANGWEEYAAERKRSGSRELQSALRKGRKIEREVGPLRFDLHVSEAAVFETLIRWKALQQEQTGAREVLKEGWVVEFLDRIRSTSSGSFAGIMSALYADGELVAAHLGMRNADVLHIWFPAYNRDYEKYSPGLILLAQLAQCCESQGIARIDLGKGPERYKRSLMSGSIPLAEGAVDLSLYRRFLNTSFYRGRELVRASPLFPAAQRTKRLARRCASRLRHGGKTA